MDVPYQIPENFLSLIFSQAQKEYPTECCGVILGPLDHPSVLSRLRPCRNAQDFYHEKDPSHFYRTSRTAYFIDPQELLELHREARERQEALRMIYHSHPDADANFSEEDARMALSEGEPVYPGTHYLVVSVIRRKILGYREFTWEDRQKAFICLRKAQ